MNLNIIGNCVPIVFTILNFQYANELKEKKSVIRISSVIYGVAGSFMIVLLNSSNKQAAFEWFLLYSVGFFFLEFMRKKSTELLSVETNPKQFDSKDFVYHRKVLIKNIIVAIAVLMFTFSPLFDKLFLNSEIYNLSRYNYISWFLSYILYCFFIFKILKKYNSGDKE